MKISDFHTKFDGQQTDIREIYMKRKNRLNTMKNY